ncbi:hepatitis A virus cellular receptor 1 homolog, partial [Trichomycterus rosablanca]|uniref:hepatitis A virus cellular receptor 1 homolog n=1 Tax=Trichomycterus rosablanca TaxID=2290929 RepID=UPI002F35B2C8
MNLLCRRVSSVWLVLCLIVRTCRSTTVLGFEGQSVTLPCKYDRRYYGKCETCWMKGDIPSMGCGAEIIATDGDKVVRQTSSRYQLNGRLQKGDVSLIIISARQNDSGKYGCRVCVPGWFNDDKYTVHLIIMREPVTTAEDKSSTPVTITTDVWDYGTSYGTNSANTAKHNNTSAPESENNMKETTDDKLPVTVMSVLLI